MSDSEDEEFIPEEEAEAGPALIKRLREKLKKAIEEKQEYLEGWQRSRAEFVNFKKEESARADEKGERIKGSLVEELLPALDSFEMALKHAPSPELVIVHKQMLEALKKLGVERYGAAGDPFDPRQYEALGEVETAESAEDHTVASVERSGYKIGNTIIRPAHVTIKNYHG